MNDLHEWFQKNDLCPENILYLYRNDRKTVIHRMDGEEVALYAPLHSVWSALPEDMFLNISKGIVVCRSQIVDISNDGIYLEKGPPVSFRVEGIGGPFFRRQG